MSLSDWPKTIHARLRGEAPPVVPVVRLAGTIGDHVRFRQGLSLAGLATPLDRAFRMRHARAVALAINSPGGSAVQSALISARIRELAAETKLPVVAFVEDVAASGGYWLACAADEILAHEASIVGSIGVVASGFGFPALLDRVGVERRLYTSGERKAQLDPFKPEDPEEVERLKSLLADMHATFNAMVRARRGERLKADDGVLFSGEFWTGRRALELGLVDGFGEIRSVMRGRYGEKVRLKLVGRQQPLLQRLLRRTALPASETAAPALSGLAAALLEAIEERALWSRYGL